MRRRRRRAGGGREWRMDGEARGENVTLCCGAVLWRCAVVLCLGLGSLTTQADYTIVVLEANLYRLKRGVFPYVFTVGGNVRKKYG